MPSPEAWPTSICPTPCSSTPPAPPSPPAIRTRPGPGPRPPPTACSAAVINATGVLLHTNLGRAPLRRHRTDPTRSPVRYSNLELDLDTGRRGSRHHHAAGLLARACGAEAALVVNNGAGAPCCWSLAALAPGRACVVSRGELVEIGGGFRIPEVMAPVRRPAGRGRHHQPDPAGRLPPGRGRRRRAHPQGPPVQLPHRRLHRDRRGRGAGRPRPAGRRRPRFRPARRRHARG